MDVEDLIPHRGRMKLIEEVLDVTETTAATKTRVSDLWPLYRDSTVDPIVLIEVVAQTSAVYISGRQQGGKSDADKRGWMVGIKQADFFRERINIHTVLTTRVKSLYSIDNYNVMEGEVYEGDDLLCRVQVQVLRETGRKETA